MGNICTQFLATLKERKTINRLIEKAMRKELTTGQIERLGEELLSFGDRATALLIKKLKNSTPKEIERLLPLVEYIQQEDLINCLFDILRTRHLDDSTREKVTNVLKSLRMEEIYWPFVDSASDELKNAYFYLTDDFLNKYEKNEEITIAFLEDFTSCDTQEKLLILRHLFNKKDPRTVGLLRLIGEDLEEEVSILAIKCLGRIRSAKAFSALLDYLSFPRPDLLRKEAEKSLQRLKLCGFGQSRKSQKHDPISYCLVSFIDGSGNQTIWVGRVMKNRKVESVCFIVNEQWGLRDCFGGIPLDVSEFRMIVEEDSPDGDLREVDINYIGKIINNALFINKINRIPVPAEFPLRRGVLGDIGIFPENYTPQFDGFDLERIRTDPFLRRETEKIFDRREFNGWIISDERIYDFAEFILKGRRAILKNYSTFYRDIYNELVEPRLKVWGKRLLFTADLINRTDNERKMTEILLCAGLALTECDSETLITHPFINRLIYESLNSAIQNILKGSISEHRKH